MTYLDIYNINGSDESLKKKIKKSSTPFNFYISNICCMVIMDEWSY